MLTTGILPHRLEPERGSGTVNAIIVMAGIFAASFLLFVLANVYQARWWAQTAADFGALAAAAAWRGGLDTCEAAKAGINQNGGLLTSKSCDEIRKLLPNGQVRVTAKVEIPILGNHQVIRRSTAGPGIPAKPIN